MSVVALIIAGGYGQRMGQNIPKQFIVVNGRPVIVYTLEVFQNHNDVDAIAVVCIKGWEQTLKSYAKQFNITKLHHIVPGGNCGQESIKNGIFELERRYAKDAVVLIHDAIRPLVSSEIISDCIAKTKEYGCAVAVIPCAEAMLVTEDGLVSDASYPRDKLKRTQTPQGFYLETICAVHRLAQKKGITDSIASCTLMIEMGKKIFFSKGSEKNIKLTTLEDIDIFKALLNEQSAARLKDT